MSAKLDKFKLGLNKSQGVATTVIQVVAAMTTLIAAAEAVYDILPPVRRRRQIVAEAQALAQEDTRAFQEATTELDLIFRVAKIVMDLTAARYEEAKEADPAVA